jgi:coenzyme F420-0:L-glutamate ligase/coenzyme F420-1:gamma-L-glutamate ligase
MRAEPGPVSRAIAARRSVRAFSQRLVDAETVRDLVALACTAPAPHHSRPWRFVYVSSPAARVRLADAMSDAWRADMEAAGQSVHTIAKLLGRSQRQLSEAPALLLACLSLAEARRWRDKARRLAERDMFVQSLGAALQNLLLATADRGLAGYLKGAPLFCPGAVRQALDLTGDWEPAFLVLLGYAEEGFAPERRPDVVIEDLLVER